MSNCLSMLIENVEDAARAAKLLADNAVLSACIQAAETEHAARIQASATRQAGTMSLAAGALALAAGAFAFFAAGRQLSFERGQVFARILAYKARIESSLDELARALLIQSKIADQLETRLNSGEDPGIIVFPFVVDAEFSYHNWENHALLGPPVVRCGQRLFLALNTLREVTSRASQLRAAASHDDVCRFIADGADASGKEQFRRETLLEAWQRALRDARDTYFDMVEAVKGAGPPKPILQSLRSFIFQDRVSQVSMDHGPSA